MWIIVCFAGDSSAASGRPLVGTSTRYPIENKIYITNHFRDALPRHPHRLARGAKKDPTATDAGAREDPGATPRKPDSNRSEYFDARSRASHHVPGQERFRASNGVGSRPSPERVTSSSVAPKGHKSRVGEFTRSLDSAAGHDGVVCKNHSPTRHMSPPGELHRTNPDAAAGFENQMGDTFVWVDGSLLRVRRSFPRRRSIVCVTRTNSWWSF